MSPFHANIERFPSHTGPQRYYYGQISVSQMRQLAIQNPLSDSMDVRKYIEDLLRVVEQELSSPRLLYRREILRCLVNLSDIFSLAQHEWMLDQFQKAFDADHIDDFLAKQYLVIGICKVCLSLYEYSSRTRHFLYCKFTSCLSSKM